MWTFWQIFVCQFSCEQHLLNKVSRRWNEKPSQKLLGWRGAFLLDEDCDWSPKDLWHDDSGPTVALHLPSTSAPAASSSVSPSVSVCLVLHERITSTWLLHMQLSYSCAVYINMACILVYLRCCLKSLSPL